MQLISISRVLDETVVFESPFSRSSMIHIWSPTRNERFWTEIDEMVDDVPLPYLGLVP